VAIEPPPPEQAVGKASTTRRYGGGRAFLARRLRGGAGDHSLAGHDPAGAAWGSARRAPAAAMAPAKIRGGASRKEQRSDSLSGNDGKVWQRPGFIVRCKSNEGVEGSM